MGNYWPLKTKCWVAFLLAHGCSSSLIKASHHIWKCPNCIRSITFWGDEKEVPAMHLRTNLATMGYDLDYLYKWAEEHC